MVTGSGMQSAPAKSMSFMYIPYNSSMSFMYIPYNSKPNPVPTLARVLLYAMFPLAEFQN